jgi:hypothetical protein
MNYSLHDAKLLSKQVTKDLDLTRSQVELLTSVILWAYRNGTRKKTVRVSGKTATNLYELEKLGFVKTYDNHKKLVGAELLVKSEYLDKEIARSSSNQGD